MERNEKNGLRDWQSPKEKKLRGLKINQIFSTPTVHPFDEIEWENRQAKITGDTGEIIFEQNDVEVPAFWSQLATKVVVSKYFYGDIDTGNREHSVKQLVHRVCKTIADRGQKDGYFATQTDAENFYNELTWLCVNQYGAFNSPVWFNVGLKDIYNIEGGEHNWHWDNQAEQSRFNAKAAMNIRRHRRALSSR